MKTPKNKEAKKARNNGFLSIHPSRFEMYFEVHHLDIPYAYEISTLQQH